jgi:acetyltransferase
MFKQYLQPLPAPDSVALVGASEREGALGRIVYRSFADGGFRGDLYAGHVLEANRAGCSH